jgi:AraC-like DNA-binding protein
VIFQYTLSGSGYIQLDGTTHRIEKGQGFLVKVPSFHEYYYQQDNDEPWDIIWLNLKGDDAGFYWDRLIHRNGSVFDLPNDSPVISCFWRLYEYIREQDDPSQEIITVKIYEWIVKFLQLGTAKGASLEAKSLIDSAKRFMQNHLHVTLSLDEVAYQVGVSKHYLCRVFRKHDEEPPLEYWRKRRMEASALMLRTTEEPITQIAALYGFNNLDYFGKTFRRYFEVSPSEYRKLELHFPHQRIFL